MAFFSDTINKQIATQLNVADQIARQKQMDVDNSIKMYSLGKLYGDNKLEGQGTRGMMNQGLISGLFTQGMDGLRGLAQNLGADVKGVERHAHNVDASLTDSLIPDMDGGLTPEQQANNERISQLQNMSTADRIKAAAFRAYDEKFPGVTDEEKEEFYRNNYLDNKGNIRSRKSLNTANTGDYEKHRAALDEEAKGELFKDEHEGLRKEMKRHGIDKIKEFSGSHSNMRNQNKKIHKALVDYYVKKGNWDKAQEINDAYVQNEMNIDKHWGMGGKREYESLFKRPTGGTGQGKQDYMTVQIDGEDKNISIPVNLRNNPQAIRAHLAKLHGEGVARQYDQALQSGTVQYMDGSKNTNPLTGDMILAGEAKTAAELDKEREEKSSGLFGNYRTKSKDAEINRQLVHTSQKQVYVNGALKNKTMLTGKDVSQIASGMGQDPLELALSLAQQTRKPVVQFLDARTRRDAIAAGIIDNQGRPMSAGN